MYIVIIEIDDVVMIQMCIIDILPIGSTSIIVNNPDVDHIYPV